VTVRRVTDWGRANRAVLVLGAVAAVMTIMVVIGYSTGKEMALRDNRADVIAAGAR
jgi:hypothetical protein